MPVPVGLICFSFPFLFGGTFIEASRMRPALPCNRDFPSFSEGLSLRWGGFAHVRHSVAPHFPSFSEGLSLRRISAAPRAGRAEISLPFRRDFH